MNSPVMLVVLSICLLYGVAGTSEEKEDSVKLTLFYYSYCPFCKQFIKEQLYNTWGEFKQYIKLDLVPFAKTQHYQDGHWVFTCMHGPPECVVNIHHACAINQACDGQGSLQCPPDQLTKAMDYIYCVMQHEDQKAASDQCAENSGLKSNIINKCTSGTEGEVLQSGYFNQSHAFHPRVSHFPFIVINNEYNANEEAEARSDLKSVICKYIPDKCT